MALRLLKADENVGVPAVFLEDVLSSSETATENALRGRPGKIANAPDPCQGLRGRSLQWVLQQWTEATSKIGNVSNWYSLILE